MFLKKKRVRLTGKPLVKLNNDINERDNSACVICGRYVSPEEKFHHEPCGPDKEDRIECGVTLCGECHHKRHFTAWLKEYRRRCEEYLAELYPEFWKTLQGEECIKRTTINKI